MRPSSPEWLVSNAVGASGRPVLAERLGGLDHLLHMPATKRVQGTLCPEAVVARDEEAETSPRRVVSKDPDDFFQAGQHARLR